MEPGEYFLKDDPVEINAGRRTHKASVRNTGDRAVQVGSHYHFFEVNRALDFDRRAAMGMCPPADAQPSSPLSSHRLSASVYRWRTTAAALVGVSKGAAILTVSGSRLS